METLVIKNRIGCLALPGDVILIIYFKPVLVILAPKNNNVLEVLGLNRYAFAR